MTIKKIDDFIFPIGEQPLSQDAYYNALSDANSGFYPFGTNGIWHGGIHVDEQVLKKIGRDDKLRCMAHGEVVAYRVNDVYPKMVYNDNIELDIPYQAQQKVAYFSTGFTLVRHCLAMPKIKDSTQAPPSITLYSLYMHQLDWYGYQQKTQESGNQITYPHYWQAVSGIVNQEKADTIKGSVIRENGSQTTVVGLLLKGSKVRLGERHQKKAGWYKIVSITAGTVVTATGFKKELGNITGYVRHKDIGTQDSERPTGKSADADRDYEICREDNDKLGKPEVAVKGIAVYATANETQKLTYLPQTASFDFDGQENGYAKIRKISHVDVPALLMAENGNDNAPHKGYVKLTALTLTHLKPEKLDKVVVLKAPIPINKGDFIGYIGHHVSQSQRFDEPKDASLANMKRASESQLPRLAHIELFTCDDLPTFINQSQALADRLPDSEKTVILVEKQAQLIQEHKPDGFLRAGLGITFIGKPHHYYVSVNIQYTLIYSAPSHIAFDTKTNQYRLTKQDKANLIKHYQATYPELTINDIPDEVELINSDSTPANKPTQLTLRFMVKNKPYWIASKAVSHLQGKEGKLSSDIQYWTQFPLTLDNLPATKDKDNNIVAYPRTQSLNALTHDGLIAIDDKKEKWVHVTAGNQQGIPITGWVNLKQAHIKQISPWHWHGFNTIEEKATLGELSDKISKNKVATLDLADYTPAMRELHHILTGTLRYSMQRKKTTQPSFTDGYLKEGLRTSWTAQQIGHLLINYESEWYADEELSKWNEIDNLYEQEKQQKKEIIEQELNKLGLTLPYQRDFALKKLNEAHEHIKTNWQLEKEKRIKPSLWWKEVAEAQRAISDQTSDNANKPILSNLSMYGKAWFIHPVAALDYFNTKPADIVTYHIYHDGRIEKHIPQEILEDYEQKYKYVYHDKNNKEHEVCIADWHVIKKKKNGVTINEPNLSDKNITEDINVPENAKEEKLKIAIKRRIKYANGNIAEYGKHDTKGMIWRLYEATNDNIEILKMPNAMNYISSDGITKIGYKFVDTKRTYMNSNIFAGFIGALANSGVTIFTGGSSFKEGCCFPSANHVNGTSIDINYFYNSNDENILLAMKKFHFEKIFVGNPNTKKNVYKPMIPHFKKLISLGGVNGGDLHNNHMHFEAFKYSLIEREQNENKNYNC